MLLFSGSPWGGGGGLLRVCFCTSLLTLWFASEPQTLTCWYESQGGLQFLLSNHKASTQSRKANITQLQRLRDLWCNIGLLCSLLRWISSFQAEQMEVKSKTGLFPCTNCVWLSVWVSICGCATKQLEELKHLYKSLDWNLIKVFYSFDVIDILFFPDEIL